MLEKLTGVVRIGLTCVGLPLQRPKTDIGQVLVVIQLTGEPVLPQHRGNRRQPIAGSSRTQPAGCFGGCQLLVARLISLVFELAGIVVIVQRRLLAAERREILQLSNVLLRQRRERCQVLHVRLPLLALQCSRFTHGVSLST